MKKIINKLLITLSTIAAILLFYYVSNINYNKHLEIRSNVIEHPTFLPKKELLKNTSFWFANLRADIYWLETIQYIWWNAVSSEYKKYLYNIISIINFLNPYFEHPYTIWELLLPWQNKRYENLNIEEEKLYNNQAVLIWLKWIKNFCNKEKINLIKKEYEINKLWTEEKYKNPCKSYIIPYYLAYVYFYHIKDSLKASEYYKIASANTDAVEWTKLMAAIMQWKWGNREKSILMFLNLAKWLKWDETCNIFSREIEKIYLDIIKKKIQINWEIIKKIEKIRDELYKDINIDELANKTSCTWYILKATREINLNYIENANKIFKKDFWRNAVDDMELFKKWYIKYLPTDYQQEDDYGIIYYYNKDTDNFDYKLNYR